MKKSAYVVSSLLIAAAVVPIGLGVAQATPTGNNGNHYGWEKKNGNAQYSQFNPENSNNGNHNGWYKTENGQYSHSIQSVQLTSVQNGTSVPEPTSLLLLGVGLAGIGICRRVARKPE